MRRPCARRLNCKIPGCEEAYAGPLEEQLVRHRVIERLEAVAALTASASRKKVVIDALDKESGDYMRHAERHCRRIKSGRIPFSPQAAVWIRRAQVYRSVLRYHAGKIRNRGNLRRAA